MFNEFDTRALFFRCVTYTDQDSRILSGRLRGYLHDAPGEYNLDETPLSVCVFEGEPVWEILVYPLPIQLCSYFERLDPPEAFYTSVGEGQPVSWGGMPLGALDNLREHALSQPERLEDARKRLKHLQWAGLRPNSTSVRLANVLNRHDDRGRYSRWSTPDPLEMRDRAYARLIGGT